jgi:hypothetical protein
MLLAIAVPRFRSQAQQDAAARDLLRNGGWELATGKQGRATLTTFGPAGAPTVTRPQGGVYRIRIVDAGTAASSVRLLHPLSGSPFTKGERLVLRFWGRSVDGGMVRVGLQRKGVVDLKLASEAFRLGPTWSRYALPLTAERSEPLTKWQAAAFLGYGRGTVDLGDVTLERIGGQ